MFAYQKTGRFFAQIAEGLEEFGLQELNRLGTSDVKPAYRGLYFSADHAALYRVNYESRLTTRVLAPLLTFDCHSDKYLYKTARALPWTEFLSLDTTFAIAANVSNSRLRHSQYAALKLKDAIVDQFREECGERPNVEPQSPDVWINLYIHNNKATISLDTSGGSLHRRGYRQALVEAPMQETVAAAIVQFSGWNGERPLYDPMCGSGTLLAEACMHACGIPAGYLREHFGFERLPDFDADLWKQVRRECNSHIQPVPHGLVSGSDVDSDACKAAASNCQLLPGGKHISIQRRSFQDIESLEDVVILCNPPYGVRLNTPNQTASLLHKFGAFLKERCQKSTAYVYLGKETLFKEIPLWPTWKKPLNNGGLHGYLAKYKIR